MKEEFYKLIEKRRSIRGYQDTPIADEILERMGEAIALAPSACNLQPYELLIITNREMLDAICGACSWDMLKNVPAIAVMVGREKDAWHRPEGNSIVEMDIAIAMEHLILAATAEGLGTCWICYFEMDKLNKALNLSEGQNVYALTPLGYPAQNPSSSLVRKGKDKVYRIIR